MADKDDDNIWQQDKAAQGEDMDDAIRKAYDDLVADDDDDDGGMDAPIQARRSEMPDVVGPERGRELVDDAELGGDEYKKRHAEGDAATEDDSADDEAEQEADENDDDSSDSETANDAEEANAGDEKGDDFEALIKGLPDGAREKVAERISQADRVMAPLKAREKQLESMGVTPEQAMNRLVELNDFAVQKPDEYLAWAASNLSSEDGGESALQKAAEKLGFKLAKAESDTEDDIFLDEDTKAIQEENARLKKQLEGNKPMGPDDPEWRKAREAEAALQTFMTARDQATGELLHPHFDRLQPQIAQKAREHVEKTGKPVTAEDLSRLYGEAEQEMRQTFGVQGNSAATAQPDVAKDLQKKAASAQRAQRASKTIDGTGPGASRRPALSPDASLDEVIRYQMKRHGF